MVDGLEMQLQSEVNISKKNGLLVMRFGRLVWKHVLLLPFGVCIYIYVHEVFPLCLLFYVCVCVCVYYVESLAVLSVVFVTIFRGVY